MTENNTIKNFKKMAETQTKNDIELDNSVTQCNDDLIYNDSKKSEITKETIKGKEPIKRRMNWKFVAYLRTLMQLLHENNHQPVHHLQVQLRTFQDYKCNVTDYAVIAKWGLFRLEDGMLQESTLTQPFLNGDYAVSKWWCKTQDGNIHWSDEKITVKEFEEN